jgi:hypothetical protein
LFARHPTGFATHAIGLSLPMIIDVALAAFSDPASNDWYLIEHEPLHQRFRNEICDQTAELDVLRIRNNLLERAQFIFNHS